MNRKKAAEEAIAFFEGDSLHKNLDSLAEALRGEGYLQACKDHEPVVEALKYFQTYFRLAANDGLAITPDLLVADKMADEALSEHRKKVEGKE